MAQYTVTVLMKLCLKEQCVRIGHLPEVAPNKYGAVNDQSNC